MDNLKKCFKCEIEKELCMFSVNKKTKDGLYSYCNECRKQYRKDNIEKIKEREFIYSKSDAFKESQKKYKSENKDKINVTRRKYRKNVLVKDHLFILKSGIRDAIRNRLKSKHITKSSKTEAILGCSFEEFKQHIEALWGHPNNLNKNGNVWMTWDNYGNPKDGIYEPNKTWDFDHIIPNSFGITEDEILKLNHYSNYQPMCSYFNRFIKKNKIIS
jgi:hypothetical protein